MAKIINKLKKALHDPRLAVNYLKRNIYDRLYLVKQYGSVKELRSESDNGNYSRFVFDAYKNPRLFNKFRSNPIYQKILGLDLYSDGDRYINEINRIWPNSLNLEIIKKLQLGDSVGGPLVFDYGFGDISPGMLRYFKTALHIHSLFGEKLQNAKVCEIGGGYGGQAYVIDFLYEIGHFTIIDLFDVGFLIRRYLESFMLRSCYDVLTINQISKENNFDLVISNFAFSELPQQVQLGFLSKVISSSKMGYLTMNSGFPDSPFNANKLDYSQIKTYLPNSTVIREVPMEEGRYIIVWGNS
jgi:hypothetical protein